MRQSRLGRMLFWWFAYTLIASVSSALYSEEPFLERLPWAAFGGVVFVLLLTGFKEIHQRLSVKGNRS